MAVSPKIPVSELKANLLEVIRAVERGESFQITKNGKNVAVLKPCSPVALPILGFAEVEIHGDVLTAVDEEDWTYDQENF